MARNKARGGAPGYAFRTQNPFGSFPLAAFFEAIAQTLPDGASVEFITLLDHAIQVYCRTQAREVRRPGMARAWRAEHDGSRGRLHWLAEVAEMYSVCQCAVYFTIFDSRGTPLFEAEDGNEWFWIADALPEDVRLRLMTLIGVLGDGTPAESLTKVRDAAV